MLKKSLSIDLSTNATQITVKYDRFNGSGNQLVKKLLKSYQKLKTLKGLKNLQKPLV